MSKKDINIKGIPIWDGKTFVISASDFFVDRELLAKCLKESRVVLEYAQMSVQGITDILGEVGKTQAN